MIGIQRFRTDAQGNPIRPSPAWFENATTWTNVALKEQTMHVARASVYCHVQVKMSLEKLFHGKCAYCESPVTSSSRWDVEHYRPKNRVSERKDHPGYYWLIYDWSNLLLACEFCNRRERDPPGTSQRRASQPGS